MHHQNKTIMENIFSQIPQSVVKMYDITADEKYLYISNSGNFVGFTEPEIEVKENETVVTLTTKTCVFSMWKNVKATHITIL